MHEPITPLTPQQYRDLDEAGSNLREIGRLLKYRDAIGDEIDNLYAETIPLLRRLISAEILPPDMITNARFGARS